MNKIQQETIENFYKEQKKWFADSWANNFVAILLIGIPYMLFLFPYTSWEGEMNLLVLMVALQLMGYTFYIKKYTTYKECGKIQSLYKLLENMPVDRFQINLFIAKKVAKPSAILAAFAMFVQTVVYVSTNHAFIVGTLIVPFALLFLLPELLVFTDSLLDKLNYTKM